MQKNEVLDKLVQSGDIKGYSLETEEYEPGSGSRETDKLTLILPSGKFLVIETFCSGSSENTSLLIESFNDIQFSMSSQDSLSLVTTKIFGLKPLNRSRCNK